MDQHQTSDDAYKQWDKIVVQSNDDFGTLRLNKDIYDILPNRLYRIRVSATNDQSEGPASEPITVRTESGGQAAKAFFYTFLNYKIFMNWTFY